MLQWFEGDGVTPLTELPIPDFEAGADSGVISFQLWNDRQNPDGQDVTNLAVAVRTEDPSAVGEFISHGVPPQDELWPRVRFVDHDNAADPTQEAFTSDWVTLGAHRVLPIPSLHAGCGRFGEIKFHPPGIAGEEHWRFYLVLLVSEHSVALQVPVGSAGTGIETGVGDRSRSHLERGGEVTAAAVPDDRVDVAARLFTWRGELRGEVGVEVAFDQADGGGEALAAGESYWAVVSQSGDGVEATKGLRAAVPEKPSMPAGHLFLRWVRVDHQPGGVSVIEPDDLDGEIVYGRHRVLPGVGREVRVHPGFALGSDTWRYWTRVEPVALPPDATSYLWQGPDGLYRVTQDSEAPSDTALGPWAEIDTDSTSVVAIRDRRVYAGGARILTLRGATDAAPGVIQEVTVTDDRLWIERVLIRASGNGGGTSGQLLIDVERSRDGAPSTLYPSSAVDDQRPVFADDAAGAALTHDSGIPEVLELRYGDVLTFRSLEHPAAAAPVPLELHLICRKE